MAPRPPAGIVMDERTLFFVLALLPALLALVSASLRIGLGAEARGLGLWAISLGLVATSAAWMAAIGRVAFLAVGLALWFSSMTAMALAVRRFAAPQARATPWLVALVPAWAVAVALQGDATMDAWRVAWVGAFFSLCACGGIHALARLPAADRPVGTSLVVIGLAVGIAVSMIRAIALPWLGHPAVFFADNHGSAVSLFMLGILLSLTLVTLGLMLGSADRLRGRLAGLASHDPLTGLLNRHGFDERATHVLGLSTGGAASHALAVVDLDDFKTLNDRLGHDAGDEVLASLGRIIGAQARASDLPARLGGEEFAVLLPLTDGVGALRWAERLRSRLEVELRARDGSAVTASIGVATGEAGRTGFDALYRRADDAMYRAKAAGKNRVVLD